LITALAIVFLPSIVAAQAMTGNELSPAPLASRDVSGDMPATTPASIDGLSIPSTDTLLMEVKQKTRPRSVDVQALQAKHRLAPDAFAGVLHRIEGWHQETLPVEPALPLSQLSKVDERVARLKTIQQQVFGEEGKVLPAALVWLATGNGKALVEAKRRALNLASWDNQGAASFKAHDQAGRSVAWTLSLAYDWLYPEFSEAERARLVVAISDRLDEILGKGPYGLDDGRKLDANPYNSHGAVALARVSAICTVMAGASPQFDACFRNTVPRYLKRPVPWGGDDGGYGNGTNYGQWDVANTHFLVWDVLRESIGVDLTMTPWARGYGKFMTYFLPPGTPTGLFGDGAEKNWWGVWATQARAYAARVPSPLADWYARQQFGENETSLSVLLAPYRDWSKTPPHIPAATPNAIHLPSIGWVAMHSSLADRGRNSVYFKSSPYGSFNHSHADQNSFVINSRGQALAIDSGYYDYYGSPHWKGWYKQTKAHNAVTFDGGQGQLHDTMAAKGTITKFRHGQDVDVVTGDATAAYGGALKRAVRTLVFLRPDTLLVYDSLASGEPRTWEWNIHALKKMSTDGSRSFELEEGGERLCGKVLDGPEMIFAQTTSFSANPKGDKPKQWHGTFSTSAKQPSLNMLTMLTVGCMPVNIVVTKSDTLLHVTVDKYKVTFSGEGQVEFSGEGQVELQ
jgi:hypothetical protein